MRMFPIQDAPDIPWAVIAPYEKQALKNHDQSLERLAKRGGLGSTEAIAVLELRPWTNMSIEYAREYLAELVGDSPSILKARIAELEAENKRLLARLLHFDPPEGLGY